MKLSHEIKYILQGGSPTDLITLDGKINPKVMQFLVDNQIPY